MSIEPTIFIAAELARQEQRLKSQAFNNRGTVTVNGTSHNYEGKEVYGDDD